MQDDHELINDDGLADLLLMAAGADFRSPPSDLEIELWLAIIGHLRFGDCKAAVIEHYADETRRIMPADVNQRVEVWRQQWLLAHPSEPYEAMPIGGAHQAPMISGPELGAQLEARRARKALGR